VILFRYAWAVFLVIVVGHALTACLATSTKPFPEDGWGTLRGTLPVWLQRPSVSMDLVWIRGALGPSKVQDGTCVIRMPDAAEGDLDPAERLVRACMRIGGLRLHQKLPAGAIRLYWHQAPNIAGVGRMYGELFTERSGPPEGFYFQPDPAGPCHVVTALDERALGHEIKHCFDGYFHYTSGRWKPRAQ
jgi:hypothetical protein